MILCFLKVYDINNNTIVVDQGPIFIKSHPADFSTRQTSTTALKIIARQQITVAIFTNNVCNIARAIHQMGYICKT